VAAREGNESKTRQENCLEIKKMAMQAPVHSSTARNIRAD